MALDYIDQIKRIQPQGPYCLLGYSFGGEVAHTMAAHLERQGERVALLAVMDTIPTKPTAEIQASTDEQDGETHGHANEIQLFANRVGDALSDRARPYTERIDQVSKHLSNLSSSHTFPRCNSGMTLFRALVKKDLSKQPISPDAWKPHVMGEIDVFDINCRHLEMDQPAHLAEIGRVLAQRLEEIHAREEGALR